MTVATLIAISVIMLAISAAALWNWHRLGWREVNGRPMTDDERFEWLLCLVVYIFSGTAGTMILFVLFILSIKP